MPTASISGSCRLYTVAGRKGSSSVIALLLLSVVAPFVSAYAEEQFTVTANKDIYRVGEKVIIVGVVPAGSSDSRSVIIRVIDPEGKECSVKRVLSDKDNSFLSRPISLSNCRLVGEYTVTARYAGLTTTSTFAVSAGSEDTASKRQELHTIKNEVINTQETVNAKLRELFDAQLAFPENIANKYRSAVSEASLALQAVEFGDVEEAKKHQTLAEGHFREVLDALSSMEGLASIAATADESASDSMAEELSRLEELRDRLAELAEKNGVNKDRQLRSVERLISTAKQMLEEGNAGSVEKKLGQINKLLNAVRADLFKEENRASTQDSGVQKDDAQGKKLAAIADRYERQAHRLLDASNSGEALAKIRESLSLIASARADIEEGDYESARQTLSKAFGMLKEAEEIIENDDSSGGKENEAGDSKDSNGEGSGSSSGSGSNSSGDDDEDREGSGSFDDDKDDQ